MPTLSFPMIGQTLLQNSNQHIQCTVAVCIADEDMSSGPCGPSVCDYWNTNSDVEAADSTAPRRFG